MFRLLRYLTPRNWLAVLGALAFIVIQVYFDLRLPDFMATLTTLVETSGSSPGEVGAVGARMLGCALGSAVASVVTSLLMSRVGANVAMRLRSAVYDATMALSQAEVTQLSVASLITRCTNDVIHIQFFIIVGTQSLIRAPILAIWAIAKIAGKSLELTLTTGIAVVAIIAVTISITLAVLPKTMRMQGLIDGINLVTREHLGGMRVERAYNAQDFQHARFKRANDDLTKTQLFINRAMAFMQPGVGLITDLLNIAIYVVGAALIAGSAASARLGQFSDLVVFSSYATQVIAAFMMLLGVAMAFPRMLVSARRINEVIDTKPSIVDGPSAGSADESADAGMRGTVEFRHASFRYPEGDEDVLRDVSFVARPGQTVAVIGSTGSGKSTLLSLIPRLFDVTQGQVLVDGVDVKEYSQHALRAKLAYVPQASTLFAGTVQTNVAFGADGDPDSARVREAVRAACADEFVEKLPEGYDSLVEQGGTNFSGGQRQRLCIARALYRSPEIFLFDDSFSALDYKTDAAVRSNVRRVAETSTVIVVAQRIGTVRDADLIVVLENGRVVGTGKHRELLRTCPTYREIALSQLSEEELFAEGVR